MIALWILGILFVVIMLILLLRVGVQIDWDSGAKILIRVSFFKKQIYPAAPKKNAKKEKQEAPKEEKTKAEKKKKSMPKLTFEDVRSAVPALSESLSRGFASTKKRIRIDPMYLDIVFGDADPCRVSEMYGWACMLMWSTMPKLEDQLRIPDPEIHLNVDFNAEKTNFTIKLGISLLVLDALAIAFRFGIPVLKWLMKVKKEKKHGNTKKNTDTNRKAA